MNRTNQRQGALSTAAFVTLPARSRLASWSHALAAALVAGSSLDKTSRAPNLDEHDGVVNDPVRHEPFLGGFHTSKDRRTTRRDHPPFGGFVSFRT